MSPFSDGLPTLWQNAGIALGFFISLSIGSYLIRDNFLARFSQYLLVGSGLGYLAVLAWRNVLWPQLFAPLIADPLSGISLQGQALWQSWLPLILGLLMLGAGVDLLRSPPEGRGGRALLRLLATAPAAILAGVALGVGITGAWQGTLYPQFMAALGTQQAAVASSDSPAALGQTMWLVRIFTLLISGGVLIHLQFGRSADAGGAQGASTQPSRSQEAELTPELQADPRRPRISRVLGLWEGIGRRALWLAAGMIFARLAASRFALVLARLEYFLFELPRSELWQTLWSTLRGGGA